MVGRVASLERTMVRIRFPPAVSLRLAGFHNTPLIYPLSDEALLPERAGCRDRFVAGDA